MDFFIITRLGVGVARPSYYKHHIELMRISLLKSLSMQSDKRFRWIVVCDSRIDDANFAVLANMVGTVGGDVFKFDPIKSGRLFPSLSDILCGYSLSSHVAISRIDDDDMISVDFVSTVRGVASSQDVFPCAISFSQGVELFVREGRFRYYENPHIALGLTVISKAESLFSPYQINHRKLHDFMKESGGSSVVISGGGPKWVYIRRPDSDSTEVRKEIWPASIVEVDYRLGDVFVECGLSRTWYEDHKCLVLEDTDVRSDIFLDEPIPRLTIKGNILKLIRDERKRSGEETVAFKSLVAAFYAI